MSYVRQDNRSHDTIRPLVIHYDIFGYAAASVLFEQGNTKVLISITLQPGVPQFLKGQRTGWLSAEYALLPAATHQRTNRESSQSQRNARSVEISRLIGRCLRTTIDFEALGERSIIVDCDVLQADGSTRVACITAASLALKIACQRWMEKKMIPTQIYKEQIAGISVGVTKNEVLVDLNYIEDCSIDADFNFVLSEHGTIIEIQGTCEKAPISWDIFENLKNAATKGAHQIFAACKQPHIGVQQGNASEEKLIVTKQTVQQAPFFSISNRVTKNA